MVPAFNRNRNRSLLDDLLGDLEDSSLRLRDSSLGTAHRDIGLAAVIRGLVNIDLRTSLVLDIVDCSTILAKDACNRPSGDAELHDVVVFLLKLKSLREWPKHKSRDEIWD